MSSDHEQEHEHLDVEALAGVLAGERPLPTCPVCAAALAELETATAAVTARLAALPPVVLPADVAARLDRVLADLPRTDLDLDEPLNGESATGSVTTLPRQEDRPVRRRWLPAAAAAVVLAGAGAFAVSALGDGADGPSADSAAAAGPLAGLVRNDTGRAYRKADLAAAVPGLLAGSAPQAPERMAEFAGPSEDSNGDRSLASGAPRAQGLAADPLAPLRTTEGLAACLAALLPPDDEAVQPLALDYGSYEGQPALVVVLSAQQPEKLDVFVVGAGCSQQDEQLLVFARADRPAAPSP